jgi:hypothetical protein
MQKKRKMSIQEACGDYTTQPLAYMYKEMQYDLRKMAIGLMGVPRPDHPSARFAEHYLWTQDWNTKEDSSSSNSVPQLPIPLKNDVVPYLPTAKYELDDAVLHFRCGDLMNSQHPSFGFMKFSGYTRHISPEASSIGIITQPFKMGAQSRKVDVPASRSNRCRIVVTSLVQYIKERHPRARVRIHNDVDETIALTYTRMIMANQTIAGISSFGVMPAIATFGTGYIRLPDFPRAPNAWLTFPRIDELTDNIVLFEESNRIMVKAMGDLWTSQGEKGVLEWFWNDTVTMKPKM